MKKLLLICLLAVLGMVANAQQIYQTFATDTVKGDTLITTANADIKYNGFVTWDYTFTGYSTGDTAYVDYLSDFKYYNFNCRYDSSKSTLS